MLRLKLGPTLRERRNKKEFRKETAKDFRERGIEEYFKENVINCIECSWLINLKNGGELAIGSGSMKIFGDNSSFSRGEGVKF